MKFKIAQNSLLSALSLVQRVISTKQVLPILEMVKVSANKKSITLEATDLTIGVSITLLAEVNEVGSCAIPIRSFYAQLATLPQLDLEVKTVGSNIEVSTGSVNLSFSTGNSLDFPELPKFDGFKWSISSDVIVKTSLLVLPSSAKDQVRPVLSSVLFVQNNKDLEIVATDGVRLSIYKQREKKLATNQVLIPSRAIAEISRILETSETKEVEIMVSEEQQTIATQIGNVMFFSKLVAGEYPPYQKIIPSTFQTTVILDKTELEENVKRSVLIGGREAGYFQLIIETDKTTLLTRNQLGESIESIIPSRELVGDPVTIAFSSRYVLDMLRSVTDQEVALSTNDPHKPAVFTVNSEPGFKFIIMPFKVRP